MGKPKVKFYKEKHEYTVNEIKAVSVTTILKEIGISEKFDETNQRLMQMVEQARERGNYYDGLAEIAVAEMRASDQEEGWLLDNDWQIRLIKELKKIGHKKPEAQLRVGTEDPIVMAGSPDFIEGDDVYIVTDLKATYAIKTNEVTWQTNLYSFAYDRENHHKYKHYGLHYDEKTDRFTVLKLRNIPIETILKALEAYQMGEQYVDQYQIVDPELLNILLKNVKESEEILKENEKKLEKYKNTIKEAMAKGIIKSVETKDFKITYTPPTTRRNFDNEAWLKYKNYDEPTQEEREKFIKISNVRDKITVTKKKK